MNRSVLKYNVAAALFSVAFLFGISPTDAYTYSTVTSTINTPTYDSTDLVIKDKSNIVISNDIFPKIKTIVNTHETVSTQQTGITLDGSKGVWGFVYQVGGLPVTKNETLIKEIQNAFCNIAQKVNSRENRQMDNKWYLDKTKYTDGFDDINKKYGLNLYYIATIGAESEGNQILANQRLFFSRKYSGFNYKLICENGTWKFDTSKIEKEYGNTGELLTGICSYDNRNLDNIRNTLFLTTNSDTKDIIIPQENITDASIMIMNGSTLTIKGKVVTSKNIKVTDNSYLNTTNSISGGDIYSDKAIISTTKDQGESIITPGNITATGALKSDTYIGAWSGAVSGKTVYSGGDVVSANFIKAGGLAKGNVLNVSAINAASASITGNQSISGVFTATGQAKLNGGAALGNKKISGLSAGTLSATSTDAVNGSQLNTIKQKLATAGKTYSAGSDVAITAANAISVAKNGTVDKGNTGIVTGGTVYKITSALNQSLDSLKASVSSHQSTLTTLSQGLSDLKSSVTNINSSVASATKNLSAQLTNRLQSDLGNLSDDGKNVIRNMVSSTLKSMNSMSIGDSARSVSAIATYEAGNDIDDNGLADIRTGLDSKVTRGDFDQVSTTVTSNSKSIDLNTSAIQKNVGDISELKVSKADMDGSNISVDGYAKRLGIGSVDAGNTGLVTGDTVHAVLDKKADYGYVTGGFGMVSSELDAMSQRMTSDLNRVGAGASALVGLHPTVYDASDKLSFAYGGGHYKNVNTSALGAFYHPNEKTMVSLAGTIGNNDVMLSAGVSIKVGMRDHVSKVIVTPKMFSAQEVANQDMKDQLDTQSERIHQIEVALQNR